MRIWGILNHERLTLRRNYRNWNNNENLEDDDIYAVYLHLAINEDKLTSLKEIFDEARRC
jgi:hypothetical protein